MDRKIFLIGLAIFTALCFAASLAFSNAAHQTRDVLDSAALMKSMDVMNNQVGVIDKLVNVLTLQNVIIGAVSLFVLIIAFILVRSRSHAPAVHQSAPAVQFPHYVSFGPSGREYLRGLPPEQKRAVVNELIEILDELQGDAGSSVVVYDKKKGRWS